jgi:hypothetical protein
VPGCRTDAEIEDCCKTHGAAFHGPAALDSIPNDGILDFIAIEVAADKTRPVRLTWIERDVAAAYMLSQGHMREEVLERLGSNLFKSKRRTDRIYLMADAIRSDGGLRVAA